jgi:hypothetical protein
MLFSDNIKCIISDVLVNRFSNPAAYFSEKHRDDPAGNRKQERLRTAKQNISAEWRKDIVKKKKKRSDEQKDWRNLKEMLCKMHI